MEPSSSCPFCTLPQARVLGGNELALFFEDGYPVNPGHTLIIPRRHVATWFDASAAEQAAMWALLEVARARLEPLYQPDGYNIGVNVGKAAGQTVFHLHMHLIPRFTGDMDDPRGGVRHVIPSKGKY